MNTRKIFVCGFIAVLLALAFAACDDGKGNITVTFSANGGYGTIPDDETVATGSSITLPDGSGLSKTGYTFGGWNTNNSGTGTNYEADSSYTVTGTITLYAKWNPIAYTVTFNINSGSGTTPSAQTANYNSSITLPGGSGLSRTSYTFGGWNTNTSGTGTNYNAGSSYTVTGTVTLYAKWDAASPSAEYWSITWNMDGGVKGTGVYPAQVVKGAVLAKPSPDPTKADSDFGGWYSNSDLTQTYNFSNPVTTNLTLYAKWNTVSLESVTGLANQLAWLQSNAQSNNSYTVRVNVDESISPHTLSYSGRSNITVTLSSNGTTGRIVSLSSNGTMFRVSSGVTLRIPGDITFQGRSANSSNSLVRVEGGTLIMLDGRITGNTVSAGGTARGGGVYVQEGTFRMEGGRITGNTVSSDQSSSNPCSGGGVYVGSNGTFTMTGGQISGNTASSSLNNTCGGGVYVEGNGTFTMSGGYISGNKAIFGNGVYVGSNGTFTMTGGQISGDNDSSNNTSGGGVYNAGTFTMSGTASIYGNKSDAGGGVYNAGTFTMTNGEISSNSNYQQGDGGGVYNRGTFTMNNGKISSNFYAKLGGGVYNTAGTFTMTGGEISKNSAVTAGGGVASSGTFRIVTGTIYGADDTELGNSGGSSGKALYSSNSAVTQRGTLSGTTWTNKGTLSTTDNTIKVLNGDLVP